MAPRKRAPPKPPAPSLRERTPLAEWVAAGLGLLLTLGVIGFLLVEGLRERDDPPNLSVTGEAAARSDGGFAVPVTVHNSSYATAAAVEVSGTLARDGVAVEQRRATFAYVPGRGEATGGLIFHNDPAAYDLTLRAEGYEDP